MLSLHEVLRNARHDMVDGSLARGPVPASVVAQWLDIIEDTIRPFSSPCVDIWCDGWFKPHNPAELRMGYSFRARVNGAVFPVIRGILPYGVGVSQPVNVSEYIALIRALTWLQAKGFKGNITVHTDSQTVWGQITQGWNTNAHRHAHIGRLWAEASQLLDSVDGRLVHEPRLKIRALLGH